MTWVATVVAFLRGSRIGRGALYLAGALAALLTVYQLGRQSKAKDQRVDDLEFGRDIRRASDETKERHNADMAQLPDDPSERHAAIADRMRGKNRLRD